MTSDRTLLDAFEAVFGPQDWNQPRPRYSPADDYDEETLVRSFGISRTARREQRRPVAVRVDELGFDRRGTYYASRDGAA